jgi:hypothetical protein
MTIQLFANNAKTTLASAVNATQTTITVAPGTGSLFPSPSVGQAFKVTLVSAATSTNYEICLCTSRTADVLTVVRGQEGTTGTPFLLSDIVGNYDTAGVMADLVQTQQLQAGTYTASLASGTSNALTATINSSLTTVPNDFSFVVQSASANTGATTLNLTFGSTITGVYPIVKLGNVPLIAGDIPSANYPLSLVWVSAISSYVLLNPALGGFSQGTGWQKFPSGLIMQWDYVHPINNNADTFFTLPITFPNSSLSLVMTMLYFPGSGVQHIISGEFNPPAVNSQIICSCDGAGGLGAFYIALGY